MYAAAILDEKGLWLLARIKRSKSGICFLMQRDTPDWNPHAGPFLRLNEVIRFLGYEKIREIDKASKNAKDFDTGILLLVAESVPQVKQ
jgi:hypothetical protein